MKEVKYLKEQGGTLYSIINGKFLYRDAATSVYLFTLVSEVFFPDGTPVRIELGSNSVYGEILSVEGFEIELKVESFIGEEIKQAKMYSEPWQLLVELSNRMEEIKGSEIKRNRVKYLLNGKAKTKHEEKSKAKGKELLYRSFYNQTTYIWGPPGTGKTYNLSRVVAQHYMKGKSVLVMAHSNAAVDVLMAEVTKVLEGKGLWAEGEVLRYGFSRDEAILAHASLLSSKLVELKHPELKKERQELEIRRKLLKEKAEIGKVTKQEEKEISDLNKALKKVKASIKEQEKKYIRTSKVIGSTLTKCAMDTTLHGRMFDLVVVDEVSMAYVPQLALAAALGKKIVVCGDFKQLPPIALANDELVEKWLREDIFHHAGIVNALKGGGSHPNLYMLDKQRRMHPAISSFTNDFIYKNKVRDHKDAKSRVLIAECSPFPNKATMLLDLAKMGAFALNDSASHSRFNIMSGLISIHLALLAKKNNLNSVGIITPYKAQARFITSCLKEIRGKDAKLDTQPIVASTVHRFQGSERDVIIFDVVDSYPQKRPSVLLTDKNSRRLVNVAVTRARGKFIQVIDTHFGKSRYSKQLAITNLTNHIYNQFNISSRYEHHEFLAETVANRLEWFNSSIPIEPEHFHKDIKAAKKSLVLSITDLSKIDKSLWKLIQQMSKKVEVKIYTINDVNVPSSIEVIPKNLVGAFTIIDDTVLWVGAPMIVGTKYDSEPKPPYYAARLHAPETIAILKGNLGIEEKFKLKRK
ncbi:MAG: AAA domain-containing protein [Neobacillus sp.]